VVTPGEAQPVPEANHTISSPKEEAPQLRNLRQAKLTRRERQVLPMIAEGNTSREIGEELRIAPTTVDRHYTNAANKVGFNRRAQVGGWLAENKDGFEPVENGHSPQLESE